MTRGDRKSDRSRSHPQSRSRSHGVAGGGLTDAAWARNADVARIGQAGERRTAAILDAYAGQDGGVTVLHDLMVPLPNVTANIDHVVVSGRTVHIIDSKVWKPARYWTFRGRTRRGWERFEPAEKQTMVMAVEALGTHLAHRGVDAWLAEPVVVVWPSHPRAALRLGLLRFPGAHAMTGIQFTYYARRRYTATRRPSLRGLLPGFDSGPLRGRPADPALVAALTPLLTAPPTSRRTDAA